VLGLPRKDAVALAEEVLQAGDHHLLLVPAEGSERTAAERPIPSRVLVCVAVGEPGKEDVLFAGRLVRHLGAAATVLKVIPDGPRDDRGRAAAETPREVERFLAASSRSLGRFGVPAATRVRRGAVVPQIRAEMEGHDLLVLGAPLADRRGRVSLEGVVAGLVAPASHPVLIVRSRQEGA